MLPSLLEACWDSRRAERLRGAGIEVVEFAARAVEKGVLLRFEPIGHLCFFAVQFEGWMTDSAVRRHREHEGNQKTFFSVLSVSLW